MFFSSNRKRCTKSVKLTSLYKSQSLHEYLFYIFLPELVLLLSHRSSLSFFLGFLACHRATFSADPFSFFCNSRCSTCPSRFYCNAVVFFVPSVPAAHFLGFLVSQRTSCHAKYIYCEAVVVASSLCPVQSILFGAAYIKGRNNTNNRVEYSVSSYL